MMWTERFLRIASEVASWSKDPSTKVGAVLVGPENTPISWGYNGFARGDDDSDHFNLDKVHKHTKVLHAEENALRSSAKTVGATIYITHPPCLHCVGRIKQAGIVRAVFRNSSSEVNIVFRTHSQTQIGHQRPASQQLWSAAKKLSDCSALLARDISAIYSLATTVLYNP